jgi:tetratricopeptide (TPR) repeat protein
MSDISPKAAPERSATARAARGPSAPALAVALLVLLSAAVGITVTRDMRYPRGPAQESVLYVSSGPVLARLALSYDALLADVYWIRALQHFGGARLRTDGPRTYELLYPLLSIATTLDPQFNIAYRFGAIFLSEPPPGGPGRPDQAIELLQRGLAARPGNWRYMQDIGFVHYWSLRDYRQAARWFERAARQPGAPWWMQSLAAATAASGGDRATSHALWTALAQTSDNEWLRDNARWRLQQLDALDARDALEALVRRYIAAGARPPYTWEDMVRAGYLRDRPVDPTGTAFYLGPYTGAVAVDDRSSLQPMPIDPAAGASR